MQGLRGILQQPAPIAAGPWFFAGAEFVLLGGLAPNIGLQLRLPPNGQGFLLTYLALGHALGCFLLGGPWADLGGRVLPLRFSYAAALPACALCAFAGASWVLALGVLLLGTVLGTGQVACIALVSENTQPCWRLVMISSALLVYVLGAAWGYFVFWAFGAGDYAFEYEWRWLLMTGCLPLIVLLPMALALLEESDVYLQGKEKLPAKGNEAAGLLSGVANSSSSSRVSSEKYPAGTDGTHISATIWAVYKDKLMETTLVATFTCFVVYFVLCTGFAEPLQGLAAPQLLHALLWLVPGLCLSSILGHWIPRASLLRLLLLLAAICEIVAVAISTPAGSFAARFFAGASLPVVIAWSAELYAASFRTRGVAASLAVGQLALVLAPVIFNILKEKVLALRFLCAALCLVSTFLMDYLPAEAVGENVEEQDKMIESSVMGQYGTP
mmetsp:Transcript_147376/g.260548  ORF Transcript_147376/g.260548 Transcript_147376/m.260548 type:complete len:442 (+) Transcript_147376:153-1478(+)